MSVLPTIDLPTYTLKLPVCGETVKFRPYLVKEQKLLTMAKESENKNSLVDAIFQILENCVVSAIVVRDLPITDIEFLFYNIRARSESEVVDLRYRCENPVDGSQCGNIMEHELNLLTGLDIVDNDISPIIEVGEHVGIKLKHQKFEYDVLDDGKVPTPSELFNIIAKNVECIYNKDSSFNASDVPLSEIVDWIGNLPTEKYAKIEHFFLNEPKIVKHLEIKCTKCGMLHNITVEDIFDFFI